MTDDTDTQIVRSTLFDGKLLGVGNVVARPSSSVCGDIERQSLNILVLPIAGVFAKHDGSRRHVIATSNHAVFISAGEGGSGYVRLPLRIAVAARQGFGHGARFGHRSHRGCARWWICKPQSLHRPLSCTFRADTE